MPGIHTNSSSLKSQNENRQQKGRQMDSLQKLANNFKQATGNIESSNSSLGQTSSTTHSTKKNLWSAHNPCPKNKKTPQVFSLLPSGQNAEIKWERSHWVPSVIYPPNPRVNPPFHWYNTPWARKASKRSSRSKRVKQRQLQIFQPAINAPVERMNIEK